jgi:predicted PurR-regulated permease PerM
MKIKPKRVAPPTEDLPQDDLNPIVRLETAPASLVSIGVLVLATFAAVCALYVGKEVVLPILLALVLKLMLQPIMSFLCDRFVFLRSSQPYF